MHADVNIHIIISILSSTIKPFLETICVSGIDISQLSEWGPMTESWDTEKPRCIFQHCFPSSFLRTEQLEIEYMDPQELFCSGSAESDSLHHLSLPGRKEV